MAKLLHVSYTNFLFSIPVASAPIDEIIQLLLFVTQAVSLHFILHSCQSYHLNTSVHGFFFLPNYLNLLNMDDQVQVFT